MIDFAAFERWSGETLSVIECERLNAAATTTTSSSETDPQLRFPINVNLNRKIILW